MVINFFTSRPSTRQWSLISLVHQGPLQNNGHWFLCHIEALCKAMIIDFFTSRPYARQWSLISLSRRGPLWGNDHRFLYIKVLSKAIVIDFFPFDINSLLRIGLICFFKNSEKKIIKQSDLSNRDPLQCNGLQIFWI